MATAAAAAAVRRRIIEHFMAADATNSRNAIPFEARSFVERRIFDRLVRNEVLRSADSDSWYLDLPTYIANRNAMKKRIAAIVGAAAAIGAALATIGIMN